MDIDTGRIRALLDKRDEIDAELKDIFNGGRERKPQKCGRCGDATHNVRNCPQPAA